MNNVAQQNAFETKKKTEKVCFNLRNCRKYVPV